MIKLIIADDHMLIREGIKKLASNEVDIEIVAETDNPFEINTLLEKNDFDILLLDLNFPEKSGLDVLKDLKLIMPELKTLILSMHPEERYAIRALKAGASGYISKDSEPENIIKAIRKIATGRKYISPELSDQLLNELNDDSNKSLHETLSDREFQVMQLIAEGKSQTNIAEQLFLSISTVNTYRSRILEKLKLKSTSDLIHYAIENKLID